MHGPILFIQVNVLYVATLAFDVNVLLFVVPYFSQWAGVPPKSRPVPCFSHSRNAYILWGICTWGQSSPVKARWGKSVNMLLLCGEFT